ncbi:aminotransferase [Pseudozyma hubeiensis SY62]|uniref:Aminotransferase n=1 Tax=Pseudozyma hubeiensis (strain SY62) TaxID=1305764 RepID=R9P5Y4_PSEHS|nr:aminotransferase [Pseudozyma hubeiensis SY62]GAC96756.1 aminotransferase [Pseudozyma hubeiensis SY62]
MTRKDPSFQLLPASKNCFGRAYGSPFRGFSRTDSSANEPAHMDRTTGAQHRASRTVEEFADPSFPLRTGRFAPALLRRSRPQQSCLLESIWRSPLRYSLFMQSCFVAPLLTDPVPE